MSGPSTIPEVIDALLLPHGLQTRGVVDFPPGDGPLLAGETTAASVVLIGHAGSSLWPAFEAWRQTRKDRGGDDPLDTWSRDVISPIAEHVGAEVFFPSDPPYQPFQRWAIAAEGLTASPLGILIHPQFGLWHGYRGALAFSAASSRGGTLPNGRYASRCATCRDRPCLTTCPVDALSDGQFDFGRCRAYLATPAGQEGCVAMGCIARAACPVGTGYRYEEAQVRFHMQALHIVVAGE